MQPDTRGFQTPSDDASCRVLLLLSRPATGGTPAECATLAQCFSSDEEQRCTLRYPVSSEGGDERAEIRAELY